jgi:nondiscriminating glutamyl-tRNA synthetase
MHLGNIRTALLNYLFAQQKQGTFVLRLEDTDPDRNFDPNGIQIIQDLQWLGLAYTEGPDIGGPFAPYQQSKRTKLYQQKLEELQNNQSIYRCFCTSEELLKKRERQKALKLPPRYDRTCAKLSESQIESLLSQGKQFIWRFKVPQIGSITIEELARKSMTFELKNFSDFPITRSDGTFTFIFANAVDDAAMKITYVLRGEDHLSNTVYQVLIIQKLEAPQPIYWHLPILCNVDGKKLSKRDFGFALNDLKKGGFLPEAINNYLAILGTSFKEEVMNMPELISAMNFDTIKTTGNIKYDVEKLKWINHKWIQRYNYQNLVTLIQPILIEHYPQAKKLTNDQLITIVNAIRSELTTLQDSIPALNFYFEEPILTPEIIRKHISSS